VEKGKGSEYFQNALYTDGSKDPVSVRVGAGVYIPDFNVRVSKQLTDYVSLYAAELTTKIIGFRWVEEVKPLRVGICSDSAAVLSSVKTGRSDRGDLFMEMMVMFIGLEGMGMVVSFC
jgi:ribonuclease HI